MLNNGICLYVVYFQLFSRHIKIKENKGKRRS